MEVAGFACGFACMSRHRRVHLLYQLVTDRTTSCGEMFSARESERYCNCNSLSAINPTAYSSGWSSLLLNRHRRNGSPIDVIMTTAANMTIASRGRCMFPRQISNVVDNAAG